MINQLISRVETITPELAHEYLRHNINNRPIRKNVVQYYASQMTKGQWILNGESIIFNVDGKLENGQHRLHAIIASGVSIQALVVRNAPLGSFSTIDSGITRKISDTFDVAGIKNATIVSSIINKYIALGHGNLIASGIGRYKSCQTYSKQELLQIYENNAEFWQDICKFASSCYKSIKLMSTTEIGAYVAFLINNKCHSKDKVYAFFSDLFIANVPSSAMIGAYRKRLMNDMCSTTRMTSTYKQQLLIKVWNNYICGKEISCIRWNEEQEGKKEFI